MTEVGINKPDVYSEEFSSWRGPSAWVLYADLLAVLTAVMLPWSTTAVSVLNVLWLLSLIPLIRTLDGPAFLQLLSRPVCLLPIAFFALAVVGTIWAHSTWQASLNGIRPVAKLLLIPILLYHFERSQRGSWVFVGFLGSCAAVVILSSIVLFAPQLKFTSAVHAGVPVKNYIDQSQEFVFCIMALAPFAIIFYRKRRFALAAASVILMLSFLFNMLFIVSARTALVSLSILLIFFAYRYLNRSQSALLLAGIIAATPIVWLASPYLRARLAIISTDFVEYQQNIPSSTGKRLEYWNRSLKFFSEAPLFGNGTGSTKHLFERDAIGQAGLAAEITRNPHNQTLNVAIQWGIVGVVLLYGMWLAHLLLFGGTALASWVGLLVVVQNITSSLFNSHLFDFHEGWMYVWGVGIAGGMCLRRGDNVVDNPVNQ